MLTITDLQLFYGQVHALKGISLTVPAREIVTLIGANGAGKSTTLKAISGMHGINAGAIELDGERIDGVPPHRIVAQGVAHCPEGRRIFYDLSVRENLLMGGYLLDKREAAERLHAVIELFPRLGERIDQAGGTLSGGEQQMLAIARALMSKPRLLMLDELSRGERCVCELAALVGSEMPTVSRHLSQLRHAGIVEDEKRGAQVFYRLVTPCVMNFFQCVASVRSPKPLQKVPGELISVDSASLW